MLFCEQKDSLAEAAQDVCDVYIPSDVSVMNLTELLQENEKLRSQAARLTFCQVLYRVEEIFGVFAGTADPKAQKKVIRLMEESSEDLKIALQMSFSEIVTEISSGSYHEEELSTLSKQDTLKNIVVANHVKHLLGITGIRMKIFRGNKKLEPNSDVHMQPIPNTIELDDIKSLVRRELSRYPIDELVEAISNDLERERFNAAVHDDLNEVAAGTGRIETGHLTFIKEYAAPWLKLWQKILDSEIVFPSLECCPVCLEPCEEQSVLISTDGCDDHFCLKCAVQCFGTGKER